MQRTRWSAPFGRSTRSTVSTRQAWLLTILRNAHVNQHRRRRPVLLGAGEVVEEGASPGADAAVDDLLDEAIEHTLRISPSEIGR